MNAICTKNGSYHTFVNWRSCIETQLTSKIEIPWKVVCTKMSRSRERGNVKALKPNVRDVFPFARLGYFRTVGKLTRKYDTESFQDILSFSYSSILSIPYSFYHRFFTVYVLTDDSLFFNGAHYRETREMREEK